MSRVERLQQLNAQAERDRTADKGLDWSLPVRHDRFWVPEILTHLYHLPVYQKFSQSQKLRYNHLFALMVIEQTVLLEDRLTQVVRRVFSDPRHAPRLPAEFHEGAEHFTREEDEHTTMFWKLAHLSAPEEYRGKRVYRFLSAGLLGDLAAALMFRFPHFSILWPWLGLYAEEKFLVFHREMKRSGDDVDPLHAQVQFVHMLDESRHVQMDEFFIQELWDRAPAWKRAINRFLLKRIYKLFIVDASSAKRLWKKLVKRHPDFAEFTPEVLSQVRDLGKTLSYQDLNSGRKNMPRSSRLFDERPECHSFAEVLPCYEPRLSESR